MLISMIEKWQKKTRRRLLGYGVSYMFPGINEWIFFTLKIVFALIVFLIISKNRGKEKPFPRFLY